MRAWREITDDVRAGTAKFEQQWAAQETGGDTRLARRLVFRETSSWVTEAAWRVKVIFTWMRLVRSGKIKRMRAQSKTWQTREQRRRVEATKIIWPGGSVTPAEEGERARIKRERQLLIAHHNAWQYESESITSGAAAVRARRRATDTEGTDTEGGLNARKRRRVGHSTDTTPHAPPALPTRQQQHNGDDLDDNKHHEGQNATANDDMTESKSARYGDSQLILSYQAYLALEQKIGEWRYQPRFGDG